MEKYPGQKTEFFLVINGETLGPISGLRGLLEFPLMVDTPVWYDGLEDWKPIAVAPLTAPLFEDSAFRAAVLADDGQEVAEEEVRVPPLPVDTDGEGVGEDDANPPALPPLAEKREPEGTPPPGSVYVDAGHPYAAVSAPGVAMTAVRERKPKSYLGFAIAATLLCNMIAGIVAIVYATKVNSKFLRGDIDGAKRCSETAQWWIAISLTVGVIMIVANLFMGRLF